MLLVLRLGSVICSRIFPEARSWGGYLLGDKSVTRAMTRRGGSQGREIGDGGLCRNSARDGQ